MHRAALLGAAFYCIWRGIRYSPFLGEDLESLPRGIELLSGSYLPIGFWSSLWLAVGIAALAGLWFQRVHLIWGAVAGLMFVWGVAFITGGMYLAVDGDPHNDPWSSWTSATSYIIPALWIITATSPYQHIRQRLLDAELAKGRSEDES